MSDASPVVHSDLDACVDAIITRVGPRVVVGAPIGLGKPNHVLNALYQRACADPELSLTIVTGLSIGKPRPSSDIERRFLEPFVERLFGNYPDLEYVAPYRKGNLPGNVEIVEFYMQAGTYLRSSAAQADYINSNYTHVGRDMVVQGVNVYAQCVARRDGPEGPSYSLSSNADTRSMLADAHRRIAAGEKLMVVGQVNEELPFMLNDAVVPAEWFDCVLDDRRYDHTLLAAPSMPVEVTDYAIGVTASTLVRDGGTLQIGIGSLGDAISYALGLRQEDNAAYREAVEGLGLTTRCSGEIEAIGDLEPFERGLYGASEMITDGFIQLLRNGVLTREVYQDVALQETVNAGVGPEVSLALLDALVERRALRTRLDAEDVEYLSRFRILRDGVRLEGEDLVARDGARVAADLADPSARAAIERDFLGDRLAGGIVMHGGFFLGPPGMYEALRTMDERDAQRLSMTRIDFVNQLFGQEALARAQRLGARFMNTTMMVTGLGAACSDALDSGRVVSGVGGQYNFVAMAHELDDARSVLMLRSTRTKAGETSSNIIWSYGHVTIPRHLRDVVVTEYGVADLRGKRDHEVLEALIAVTDSRFQEQLLADGQRAGKVKPGYRIPDAHRANTPARLVEALGPARERGLFPAFPFGSEFTDEELVLGKVLKGLQGKLASKTQLLGTLFGAIQTEFGPIPDGARPYLARMGLESPGDLSERMLQRVLVAELTSGGHV